MTWTPVTTVGTTAYSAVGASAETWGGLGSSAATFSALGAFATTYASTMTLSSVSFRPDISGSDHRLSRVYPFGGADIGINFVYRVRNPGDWTVRTDRPKPITSQISDSP